MSEPTARFSATLHRIEVHAGPIDPERGDEFQWSVWVQAGQHDSILIWGYVRRVTPIGVGQALGLGLLLDRSWSTATEKKRSRQDLSKWVEEYASEVLWDTTRRALQMQAAMMDFQFDLDVQSPKVEIGFKNAEGGDLP